MSIMAILILMVLSINTMEVKANPYYNAYEYNTAFGSDSCQFAVVEGEGRIYFGAYGTEGSTKYARYRTIGWKARKGFYFGKEKKQDTREERNRKIILLYKNQIPQVDIADYFDISVDYVERVIRNAGIEINPRSEKELWKPKKVVIYHF